MRTLPLTYKTKQATKGLHGNVYKFPKKGAVLNQFGFNGQLKDNEIYGEGNAYTAEFWEYDPRSVRRWNVDINKREIPQWTPYVAFGANPILNVDPDGAWFFGLFGSTKEQRKAAKAYAAETGGEVYKLYSKDLYVATNEVVGKTSISVLTGNKITEYQFIHTKQFFYRDGSMKRNNTLDSRDYTSLNRTGIEQFDNWINEPSSSVTLAATKGILNIGWGTINAPAIFMTQRTWTGRSTTENERVFAFGSFMPGVGGVAKLVDKPIKLLGQTGPAQFTNFRNVFKSELKGLNMSKVGEKYRIHQSNIEDYGRLENAVGKFNLFNQALGVGQDINNNYSKDNNDNDDR